MSVTGLPEVSFPGSTISEGNCPSFSAFSSLATSSSVCEFAMAVLIAMICSGVGPFREGSSASGGIVSGTSSLGISPGTKVFAGGGGGISAGRPFSAANSFLASCFSWRTKNITSKKVGNRFDETT